MFAIAEAAWMRPFSPSRVGDGDAWDRKKMVSRARKIFSFPSGCLPWVGNPLPTQAAGATAPSIWQASPQKRMVSPSRKKILKIPANKFPHSALSY
jgi:hypothetical protein